MTNLQILKSAEDASVNFIFKGEYPGYQEARYVRRQESYMIVYVSSQTGCNQACRFCHLTATKQTKFINLTIDEIIKQAEHVLEWYSANEPPAKVVHFNFMARGCPFDNLHIINGGDELVTRLHKLAAKYNLYPKVMISTILPEKTFRERELSDIFRTTQPTIYYSLYSVKPEFREKWIPNGLDPEIAFKKLKTFQSLTGKVVKLHWAFIKNENDSEKDVAEIIKLIYKHQLQVDINIVRYNPYSEIYGQESDLIYDRVLDLRVKLPTSKIKVVERVGFDCKASCGMFVEKFGSPLM